VFIQGLYESAAIFTWNYYRRNTFALYTYASFSGSASEDTYDLILCKQGHLHRHPG